MSSRILIAWPLAVSGYLPIQCDGTSWPPDESGGAAGNSSETGGTASETGGTANETGGSATGGTSTGGNDGDPEDPANEPILGCDAGVRPEQGTSETLPWQRLYWPEFVTGVSANGEVVLGYTTVWDLVTDDYLHRPVVSDGSDWQTVVPEAASTKAVINCDGTVVAGGYDRLHGFIKRAGQAPVILIGKGNWATEPSGISADGTRVVGNLAYHGDTWNGFGMDPVVWTDLGVASYLWPKEPRMALHITFDGGLIAGLTDHCNYPAAAANCGVQEHLFTSTGRPNETLYPGAPAKLMSSDGSTFADTRLVPQPNGLPPLSFARIFRPSSGLTEVACPPDDPCEVVDISSRGNILLLNARRPLLWTKRHGLRLLRHVLVEDGVNLPFHRFSVTAMSDDGRVIVGHGYPLNPVNLEDAPLPDGPRPWSAFRVTLSRNAYE
ncbi:MAG: hypothetical protein M3020_08700 [Myxococcota bacterium]|nr:hypothetical protein [Myxococcota bacterium]